MRKQSIDFKNLVKFIRNLGYTVDVRFQKPFNKKYSGYWYGRITTKSIFGGFCDSNDGECYWAINGRIAFDNKRCFDKWGKCPYSLELPRTPEEFQYVADQLKYIRTREGFKRSNEYDIRVRDYPFSTHVLCPDCEGSKRILGKRKFKMRPKDISEAQLFNKASGLDPNFNLPMYRQEYIKCPKCKGSGKIKRK
jgi:hypothetical protein